jgi:hypothetical protein
MLRATPTLFDTVTAQYYYFSRRGRALRDDNILEEHVSGDQFCSTRFFLHHTVCVPPLRTRRKSIQPSIDFVYTRQHNTFLYVYEVVYI